MTIQKRALILTAIAAISVAVYATAGRYASSLTLYVVEQSLIQKAPANINASLSQQRLHVLLSATPDKKARMKSLLHISQYLEKTQRLTQEEWESLLPVDPDGGS